LTRQASKFLAKKHQVALDTLALGGKGHSRQLKLAGRDQLLDDFARVAHLVKVR